MRALRRIDALVVSIVLVGACSTFETTPPAGASDAGTNAGASDAGAGASDASVVDDAGVRCDHTAPFTSIRPIDGVNTPENEAYPRVSADERVIYFQRTSSSGPISLLRASRASAKDAFEMPIPVAGLPVGARQPAVTDDELEILFVQVAEAGRHTLWHARRAAVTEPFGEAAPYPIIEDPHGGRQTPFIAANGAELFFAETLDATNTDLYRATRGADGGFGIPEALATLNASTIDHTPVLSPDLLSLYFYSDRNEAVGKGAVWVAHRDTPTGPFRAPVRVEELVFPGSFTIPGAVSVDGCRLYFSSSKDVTATGYDLYVAERSPR